jgi:hypothetical protein
MNFLIVFLYSILFKASMADLALYENALMPNQTMPATLVGKVLFNSREH